MGKAYNQACLSHTSHESQRDHVKTLLEAGRDEDTIEKESGVSDRTIRRWKTELEKTGRIGKPPESRTGRHRVLNAEVENALFEHVKDKPDMSVDDMLWWLYDRYKIVVGTRTIRRVFERKGDAGSRFKKGKEGGEAALGSNDADGSMHVPVQAEEPRYESPYAPVSMMPPRQDHADMGLAHALTNVGTYPPPPVTMDFNDELPEDEEMLQLELQRIELAKREVEVKLKMRRLQQNRGATPQTPASAQRSTARTTPSTLYKPVNKPEAGSQKRDSRSKKKIEESRRRTAERQERMLKDLERRSRRREHLTAEWVQSKDIWPLRAQSMLADLTHRYMCYTYGPSSAETFEMLFRDLYALVDLSSGDWQPAVHDELLRERMKRKMGQLRTKMVKTGEIVARADGYGGSGWQKADDYTGEQAGQMMGGDEHDNDSHHDAGLQAQAGAQPRLQQAPQQQHVEEAIRYDPMPEPSMSMQHATPFYSQPPPMMHHHAPAYAMDHGIMPYGHVPHDGSGMFHA